MHTLILNGSPHTDGNTMTLVHALTANLPGDCTVIHCYETAIAPCTDCRACRTRSGCVIKDEMQTVYPLLEQCDNLVIASPVYYASLTGRLLDVISRFQCYDSAKRFRHAETAVRPKRGAAILTCGGSGGESYVYRTSAIILRELGAKEVYPLICSSHTDTVPASADDDVLAQIRLASDWLGEHSK